MSEDVDGPSAPTDRQIIEVHRVSGGWIVSNALLANALVFLSRRQAEDHAKTLANRLTRLGVDSRVDLHDRNGVPAGSIWFWGECDTEPRTAGAGHA